MHHGMAGISVRHPSAPNLSLTRANRKTYSLYSPNSNYKRRYTSALAEVQKLKIRAMRKHCHEK
jgi:hypothetical protein